MHRPHRDPIHACGLTVKEQASATAVAPTKEPQTLWERTPVRECFGRRGDLLQNTPVLCGSAPPRANEFGRRGDHLQKTQTLWERAPARECRHLCFGQRRS
jgi:hypothetical protein